MIYVIPKWALGWIESHIVLKDCPDRVRVFAEEINEFCKDSGEEPRFKFEGENGVTIEDEN